MFFIEVIYFHGDVGGPVYQFVLGRPMLVGINSRSPGTCYDFSQKVTGRFVDIRPHSKWISSMVRGKCLKIIKNDWRLRVLIFCAGVRIPIEVQPLLKNQEW